MRKIRIKKKTTKQEKEPKKKHKKLIDAETHSPTQESKTNTKPEAIKRACKVKTNKKALNYTL